MAKVEVEQGAYDQAKAVVDLVRALETNPATRKQFLELVKSQKPDLSIPEIDAAKPFELQLEAMRKQQEDFFAEQRKQREETETQRVTQLVMDKYNGQKNALLDAGYMEDAIPKIEEFAKQRGIPDLEAAAALFEKQNPAYLAEASRNQFGDFFKPETDTGKAYKELFDSKGKSSGAEQDLIRAALSEVRASNRRF